MSAYADLPRPRHGLALALVETEEPAPHGQRSRWTVALVQLDPSGAHALEHWHGVGPLGRLRARSFAAEYCAQAGLDVTTHYPAPRGAFTHRTHALAALLARLRAQGVI